MKKSAEELFEELNDTDESEQLEAKSIRFDSPRSLLETICSFSNEPGLGGGVIILGVAERDELEGPRYEAEDITDLDKRQLDIATQCKSCFNRPVFPRMTSGRIDGKRVLLIEVEELPIKVKPLYFKADKLPDGAYRRVGTADVVCTSDDLADILDNGTESYDATPMRGAGIEDVDPRAIAKYRELRSRVNPSAEELDYNDEELLQALNCVSIDNPHQLNLAGVLLFGSAKVQRRLIPMARVDYIRVPTMEWVENPDESYATLDTRGPLMLQVNRLINVVNDDLVKDFSLLQGAVQSNLESIPQSVIREAIVNALMHSSYKVGSPIQIVRYPNRIEIKNAGYSLKSPDRLGSSGSVPRNKLIAPVFHETNLAETKGGGIRRMTRDMQKAHFSAPTFESDRVGNTFTLRLLLHHFLNDQDLTWLMPVNHLELTDGQKMALVFLREVGAIDNNAYRQLSGVDTLRASYELRRMKELNLIVQKGKGQRTYYRPGSTFPPLNSQGNSQGISQGISPCISQDNVERIVQSLPRRMSPAVLRSVIQEICSIREMTSMELARTLKRSPNYLTPKLTEMVKLGLLRYRYPQMPNHPDQAYSAPKGEK